MTDMLTVLEIIKKTTDFFAAKGIESPRLNAELLIGHALNRKRMQLYLEFERPLAEIELESIRPLVRRRAQHEPMQYIIGETEFCGLKLKVDRRALIPRPETEQLVERIVSARASAPPATILDLGTGSGSTSLLRIHLTCHRRKQRRRRSRFEDLSRFKPSRRLMVGLRIS
jgi:release factor glutamine methyltransferase